VSVTDFQYDGLQRDLITARRQGAEAQHRVEAARKLADRWKDAAAAIADANPLWSAHFRDCAAELERVLGGRA